MNSDKPIPGKSTQYKEPDWQPLLDMAPHHVDDFMWMHEVELEDGTRLHAYKHYWTRRYMHLSSDRRAFVYREGSLYEEVAPCWLFDLALRRSLVPDDPWE
jgi:hypothetical protein